MSQKIPVRFRAERERCLCASCKNKKKSLWYCSVNAVKLFLDKEKNVCSSYDEVEKLCYGLWNTIGKDNLPTFYRCHNASKSLISPVKKIGLCPNCKKLEKELKEK